MARFIQRMHAVAAVCIALATPCAFSQSLTIGVAADISSLDPHFHNFGPNNSLAAHVFDRLISRDATLQMQPALAESWKAIDERTWIFKLRPNVKFHDGSPFTSADVVFSIERPATIKDSPGPFTGLTKGIASAVAVDPLTVKITTTDPAPLLPANLAALYIVSKAASTGATTADFNSGKAAIGTGPFKFVKFARGDRVELVRNDAYWGKKPEFERVAVRIISNDASRVAALLSGDVQMIDQVPIENLSTLKGDSKIEVASKTSTRLIYLNLANTAQPVLFTTDKDGKPLEKNPFADVRVRRAVSLSIDRNALRDRVMGGFSTPAGQLVPQGIMGYVDVLKADASDPVAARKLLADAGYPQGFNVTLHGPNNRYVNDAQILQTVAQYLARIGITARVETMPSAVFFPRQNKSEFAFGLTGWSPDTYEASNSLVALTLTKTPDKGWGTFNTNGYSNPALDELVAKALSTVGDAARERLLQDAVKLMIADLPIVPLHFQQAVWATRLPLHYVARADERTFAFDVTSKK